MSKLTFKQFYELSKKQLLEASDDNRKVTSHHIFKSYCKLPVNYNNEVIYLKFKPQAKINVLWEFIDKENKKITSVIINETSYIPSWSDNKLKDWLTLQTRKIKEYDS